MLSSLPAVLCCQTATALPMLGGGHHFELLGAGAALLNCSAAFVDLRFLGTSLTFMMVYVWGRRNAHVTLSFLGVFNFTAPYLPWVLLGFSVMLRSSPVVDLLGMAVGEPTCPCSGTNTESR